MTALRAGATLTRPFAQKFDDAAQYLAGSLSPAYWVDQTHLQPEGGNADMNEEKLAAGTLERKMEEDLTLIGKGDGEAGAGRYSNAIEHYRNTWRHALQLHLQVALNADGTTHVQFVGNNSKAYEVEVSTDMVHWQTLGTCTADSDGNVEYTDPNAAQQPQRFYRAIEAR